MSDEGLKEYAADKIIWLDTDPDECYRRIASRGREGEDLIELDYLVKCDRYHRDWMKSATNLIGNEQAEDDLFK